MSTNMKGMDGERDSDRGVSDGEMFPRRLTESGVRHHTVWRWSIHV